MVRRTVGREERPVNVVGWVWAENFRPYLRFLSRLVGREMDEGEMAAVEASVEGSDAELGYWRRYVLPGRPEIALSLAYETGFDNVQIQFDCDERTGARAEAAMEVMAWYSLRERRA